MWVALSPFRRLTQMIGSGRTVFGDFSGGIGTTGRRFGQFGRRVVTGALGTFAGTSAAMAVQDEEAARRSGNEPPARTETWSAQGHGGSASNASTTGEPPAGAAAAGAAGAAAGLAGGLALSGGASGSGPPAPEPEDVPAGAEAEAVTSPKAEAAAASESGGGPATGLPDARPTPAETGTGPLFVPEDQPLTPMEAATPAPVEPEDVEHDDIYVIYRPGDDGGEFGGR
jgi:hypothetical protein